MEIALIYPHQLFAKHSALALKRPAWLIEEPLFFGNDKRWPMAMHQKKLMLHRAAMKAYAEELKTAGHVVRYVDAHEEIKLPEKVSGIHVADPADEVLSRRLRRMAEQHGATLVVHPSPNFLSPPEFLESHIAKRKKPFMAKFYEAQRKRMNLLLEEDGTPVGGKWSFDTENRARLPKNHFPPPEPRVPQNEHVREAENYVSRHFSRNPGNTHHFRWPVTRRDAEHWLDHFIDERLASFGIYEDAISIEHATIYHSAITPALNIGLLDPQDVINRVMAKATDVPLNSLEGFIRQVIGWREFMHGIYRHRGVEIRNGNFWQFDRPMPAAFYDGTTGIPPVDRVIRQLLDDGWCHHIERLMVLGNFMLLCRIRPDDVYRWFMEMFVDSYDWVMVPNVYGMSQFADGGTFTTKPYLSGSNYVLKMSDEPRGPWCEIWDGLFWCFIGDHLPFFLSNPRLSMMARTWEKLAPTKQAAHRDAAEAFLTRLE
jgi:deoxyribodipyrimidine photolyase-related protein